MDRHRDEFSIQAMARVLGVSRSGYYAHRRRPPSERAIRQADLDERVRTLYETRKGRYGAPRLTRDLAESGLEVDPKTVAKSLSRQGLVAKAGRKFKATTKSDHDLPVAPNHLDQDFTAEAPNQKWVGDITYLWTDEGWLYLATVIDLYSRRVIGWSLSERMQATLVCDALQMALWRRKQPKGVIVHSDRGSQYCSRAYQGLLERSDLVCSMSGVGNCYDNAVAESFFHTLKVELIHGERFATRDELRRAVFEYIETDYNRIRRHSALGYLSPVAFEAAQSSLSAVSTVRG